MNKNKHLIESLITDINDRLQNHTMTLEQANLLESQKKLLQNLLISVIHKDDMDINDLNIIEDISNELLDNDCESEVFKKIPDEIKLKQKDYVIVECKSCLYSILDEISFLNSVNFELNDDSKKLLIQCFEDYLFLSNNFLDVIYDNVLYFARIDKAKSIFNKYLTIKQIIKLILSILIMMN
jgi:ferredoxin-like protein FixX